MEEKYYKVNDTPFPRDIPISADNSYHDYGFERPYDFLRAVNELHRRFVGQVGKVIDERTDMLRLKFAGGTSWVPTFMLTRVPPPVTDEEPDDEVERLLDRIFGFKGYD